MNTTFTSLAILVRAILSIVAGPNELPKNAVENPPLLEMVDPSNCNNPIVGKGVVINYLGSTTACLLCQDTNLNNIIDGDLSDFAEFNMPLSLAVATPIVSVKDVNNTYAAGHRVGFVLQASGGLLNTTAFGDFTLKTYKNGVLQETANYGGGGLLDVGLIAGQRSLKRVSFVSTQPFDEIELWLNASIAGVTSLRVYYAFEDVDANCDYNCLQALSPPSFSSSINAVETGISGICVLCSVSNTSNVVDNNTNNYSTIFLTANAGGTAKIAVKAGQTIPAGYDAGFAVSNGSGALGLLSLDILSQTSIKTYLNGVLQESIVASSELTNIGLLPGSSTLNLLSFKTTANFDEVQLVIGGITIASNTRVYYAFIRADSDNDGVYDCLDKCNGGNDMMDTDGDGIPDDCEIGCSINAGPDIHVCPVAITAQLPGADTGQNWNALPGNPSNAIIDNNGFISNLEAEGIYYFELSEGSCRDTVRLIYQMATLSENCNDPLTGTKVIIDNIAPTGGLCLLCNVSGIENIIDGDQSNYIDYNATLALLTATSIISLRDTATVYPSGTRTGYVVNATGGLIDINVLSNLEIRTYLNGVYRESGVSGGLLQASVLPGSSNQVRIGFVTTKSFNEVELVAKGVLGVLNSLKIYYGFTEPEGICSSQPQSGDCEDVLSVEEKYSASIDYNKTGLSGLACVLCNIDEIGNLIDNDLNTYTTINLTVGVGAEGSVAVKSAKVISAGNDAGFIVSGGSDLLDVNVLQGIRITTFLGGVQQEDYVGNSGVIKVNLLIDGSNKGYVSFPTMLDFDEVKFTVSGLVNVLSNLKIYGAFIRSDIDGDGIPDCYDKCCGSPDYIDADGNGLVDCVDPQCYLLGVPIVGNDTFQLACPTLLYSGSVKLNDNNLVSPFFSIMSNPAHGIATITQNGSFQYTAQNYFCGTDQFTYRVCNGNNGDCCSIGTVVLSMNDNMPPTLQNFPADLTMQCDDYPPTPLQLHASDNCPVIYISLDETIAEPTGAACNTFQLNRTWTATDHCENSDSRTQVITVEDHVAPDIFHVYTLPNGKKMIAGISELTSDCWKRVVFCSSFESIPIVFSQVVSKEDSAAVVVQQRNIDKYSFQLKLKEEELSNGTHAGEKVAWIAIESGVIADEINWEASFTNTANDIWSTAAFLQNYAATPIIISSLQTTASTDPVGIRSQAIQLGSMQIMLQEETSKDLEVAHTSETVGFLVLPNNKNIKDADGLIFGETGTVQTDQQWVTVNLRNKYVNPVVVAGTISNNDFTPVTVRIRNLNPHTFEIQLDEWDYQDGVHAPEQISYVVVEGSLPTPVGQACELPTDPHITGWDNCDEYVPISHTAIPQDSNGIIIVNHQWSLNDQCGNSRTYHRVDTCDGVSFKLKVLLSGALLQGGNSGLMRDDLRKKGLIPDNEPYTDVPNFFQVGYGGDEIMKNGMKDIEGENAVVDWVFIEIRNNENSQEVLATQSAIVKRNGQVVNANGDSIITILGLIENDYFVAVRHRNHLGIMTNTPYFLSAQAPPFIDLSSVNTEIYGIGEWACKALDDNTALWAGDLNSDGIVIYQGPQNDISPLFVKIIVAPGNTGYLANYILESYETEDTNLDGSIIYQGPNNDRSTILINTVLSHPANSSFYANFIVNEILP
ncbi:MAG: hypothetical protein GC192_10915 [Bacteroidetes bacterium]|nr:hypothetical protein [Bacteroidota bacterium]